jgi:REP element-mobilizing transposase RayT
MEDPSAYLNPLGKIDQHGSRLPHWQQGDALQFVTFRQKDALPQSKLVLWRSEKAMWLSKHPKPWTPKQTSEYSEVFTERIEEWLDAGMGSCLFNHAENREALKIVIMKAAPANAELHAWVIMPNHAHVLFRPLRPLPELIKAWKRASAQKVGKGSIWQRNYRDTLIRNSTHYARVVRYIRKNPVSLAPNSYSLWESESAQRIK